MIKRLLSITISFIGLLYAHYASACIAPRNYIPENLYEAEVAFKGRVINVEYIDTPEHFKYIPQKTITILTYKVEKTYKGKARKHQRRVLYGRLTDRYNLPSKDWRKVPKINISYLMGAKKKTRNVYEDTLEFIDYGYCKGSLVFDATTLNENRVDYTFRQELGLSKKRIDALEKSILKELIRMLKSKNKKKKNIMLSSYWKGSVYLVL